MPVKEQYNGYSKNKDAQAKYKAKKKVILDAIKDVPCSDCGMRFPPCAMDFDHRNPEEKEIQVGLGWSIPRALAEIEKCDVVCANCHRIREHERRQAKKKMLVRKKHPKRKTATLMCKEGVGRWAS